VNGRSIHARRARRACAGVAVVAAVVLAWSAPGCNKDKESLIVVGMQARDGNLTDLKTVTITVAKAGGAVVERTFTLPDSGLPVTPDSIEYGVWIGATGTMTVTAVARQAGASCDGYVGMHPVNVSAAGVSVPVIMIMSRGNTCTATGTAGTTGGGGSGFGGSGGGGGSTAACGTTVGSRPPAVAPPSLANCTDLTHAVSTGPASQTPAAMKWCN
jgi:hypothetical protein